MNQDSPKPAIDPRVLYDAERTMLAWIRTGLAMMGFGFVVARFSLLMKELIHATRPTLLQSPGFSLWIGTALVGFGVLVNLSAGFQYAHEVERIRNGSPILIQKWSLGRVSSLALAGVGLIMVAYLVRLGR